MSNVDQPEPPSEPTPEPINADGLEKQGFYESLSPDLQQVLLDKDTRDAWEIYDQAQLLHVRSFLESAAESGIEIDEATRKDLLAKAADDQLKPTEAELGLAESERDSAGSGHEIAPSAETLAQELADHAKHNREEFKLPAAEVARRRAERDAQISEAIQSDSEKRMALREAIQEEALRLFAEHIEDAEYAGHLRRKERLILRVEQWGMVPERYRLTRPRNAVDKLIKIEHWEVASFFEGRHFSEIDLERSGQKALDEILKHLREARVEKRNELD